MKTRVLLMTGLFALTMIAAGQVAQAQQAMLVDVPFDFVAAGTTLPAGEYRVSPETTTGNVLLIRSQQDLNTAAMVPTNGSPCNELWSPEPYLRSLPTVTGFVTYSVM